MKNWVLKGIFLALGLAVLFISITRAGLELLTKDISEDKIENTDISFVMRFGDGETQPGNYKLPQVGMLPTNPLYGLKDLRDWMWLNLASKTEKPKIAMLLADKKITETKKLFSGGNGTAAIESGNEALDKLEYADQLVESIEVKTDDIRQLKKQIFMGGYALKNIVENAGDSSKFDDQTYPQLLDKINQWNEKQDIEKTSWNK